ncbi:hypothetical protein D3C84_904090 [compost metagenome]
MTATTKNSLHDIGVVSVGPILGTIATHLVVLDAGLDFDEEKEMRKFLTFSALCLGVAVTSVNAESFPEVEICKQLTAHRAGRSITIMHDAYGPEYPRVTYRRPRDGKVFTHECLVRADGLVLNRPVDQYSDGSTWYGQRADADRYIVLEGVLYVLDAYGHVEVAAQER